MPTTLTLLIVLDKQLRARQSHMPYYTYFISAMPVAQFGNLPIEIQYKIWSLAVPDDEAEVCVADGPYGDYYVGRPPNGYLCVYTAYPVPMHICRESRIFAKNTALSGARFRKSDRAGFAVPYRAFRPDLDTLKLGRGDAVVAKQLRHLEGTNFQSTQHLAFDASLSMLSAGVAARYLVQHLTDLRTVRWRIQSCTCHG